MHGTCNRIYLRDWGCLLVAPASSRNSVRGRRLRARRRLQPCWSWGGSRSLGGVAWERLPGADMSGEIMSHLRNRRSPVSPQGLTWIKATTAGDPDGRIKAQCVDARALGRTEALQRPSDDAKATLLLRGHPALSGFAIALIDASGHRLREFIAADGGHGNPESCRLMDSHAL